MKNEQLYCQQVVSEFPFKTCGEFHIQRDSINVSLRGISCCSLQIQVSKYGRARFKISFPLEEMVGNVWCFLKNRPFVAHAPVTAFILFYCLYSSILKDIWSVQLKIVCHYINADEIVVKLFWLKYDWKIGTLWNHMAPKLQVCTPRSL